MSSFAQPQTQIRPFLRSDATLVSRLDSTFITGEQYVVRRTSEGLALIRTALKRTASKTFPLDLGADPWEQGFVCQVDGRICGFVGGQFQEWNRRLVIWHFYVDSKCRGKGLGRMLMREMLAWGRSHDACAAWVETSNLNAPGVRAYEKLGFRICGFDESLYFGTENAAEFALFLSNAPVRLSAP